MLVCKYCRKNQLEEYFECSVCGEYIHTYCLKQRRVPGGLLGDVFFVFTCTDCGAGEEHLERDRMAWVDVAMLALYNLTKKFPDQSYKGYFHWNKHIKRFINNHWKTIFPHMKTKRKTWIQMLCSALKSFSPHYFACGDDLYDFPSDLTGWYKLSRTDILPNHALLQRKGKKKKRRYELDQLQYASHSESDSLWFDSSSQDTNQASTSTSAGPSTYYTFCNENSSTSENMYSRSYVKPTALLSEFLFDEEDTCDDDIDIEVTDTESTIDFKHSDNSLASLKVSTNDALENQVNVTKSESAQFEIKEEPMSESESAVDFESKSEDEYFTPSKSLFIRNENGNNKPWVRRTFCSTYSEAMNENEEHYLLASLIKKNSTNGEASVSEIRMQRKLRVRRLKRERNLPVFDLDSFSDLDSFHSIYPKRVNEYRILDRFQHQTVVTGAEKHPVSFRTRLMGHSEEYLCFTSPFTQRVLKPFIRRDYESSPLWLKLLEELQTKVNSKIPDWVAPPRASLDYSYVRPQHIPAVNSLAQQYFWPGINLSECLQYPDFSCVVLYKKLVVAFAFLVPDVRYNEAYISFIFTRPEWRRCGIATFMLYHLIQTCMGRDITLHVSATNPALLLYQKFGFKVEEFVQDFYEKYLPIDSNECKHALFLRLCR